MSGANIGPLVGIGVDFGTTNSVVALAFESGHVESLTWPSAFGATDTFRTALMFWREGRKIAHAAGPSAIARAIAQEGEQRFIQSIKTYLASRLFSETRLYGERFTIERLIAVFLTALFDNDGLRGAGGFSARPAVISGRPVVFAGETPDEALAVSRLRTAYDLAGVTGVELAFEPLGAAYWYARKLDREETVLVADFGGGTSDFSVLRFARQNDGLTAKPLAHSGVGVAGDTFDYRIIDHVVAPKLGKDTFYRSFEKRLPIPAYFHAAFAQWHQLSWLKTTQTLGELRKLIQSAEEPRRLEDLLILIEHDLGFELYRAVGDLKAKLSAHDEARFLFAREGIEIEADVSRKDFEGWIAEDLEKISAAMDEAIAAAGLTAAGIDAVFLTGGTSFVPAVRALFTRRFGGKRVHIGDAFQSVASGLALIAADRAGG
ncbi:Hsp70 family protein [Methylocella tundrae]|uniref:HSP70 family molecular chaperone n=1 Tax=Methylocella tundrae TaxID=227605 RepID=A0A4V6IMG2_METTU|nr:Hsp70 family protein [Methylocella tundrae]WPP05810.1 Hsp70 family protein [Methylocella tundrae]VFU08324.1 HSP70 family molecular chaperone [Methylocella tundrae]